MYRLILSTFFFIVLLNKTAIASPTALTPSLILHSFPICNISSSLGQRCKSLSDNERVNFVPSSITNATPDFINEERLEIVTEDWNYSFILETAGNNTATVEFIDDAKFATYVAATKYYLEWNSKIQNWVIIGEEVTYLSGSADDKKIEGKYFALSSPVSLLEK